MPELVSTSPDSTPPDVLRVGAWLGTRAELEPVWEALRRAKIAVLAFKGEALARSVYADAPWERPMSDSDLWVRPADRPKVESILERLEFRRVPCSSGQEFARRVGPLSVRIDLHDALWFLDSEEADACWARAQSDTPPVHLPSLEDHLVWIAVHAVVGHGQLRPVWREDLRRLMALDPDYDQVVARADRWGVASAVGVAFGSIATCPARLRDALAPRGLFDRWRVRRLERAVAAPELPNLGHWLRWLYLPSHSERLNALVRQLFPRRDFLARRYTGSTVASRWRRPGATLWLGARTLAVSLLPGRRSASGGA